MLTLTADDLTQIRFLVGSRVTTTELSDAQIQSDMVLGVASDYVYENVILDVDLSKLTVSERAATERIRDDTPDNIDAFVSTVLKPPQSNQFKRAVRNYAAGLCVQIVQQVESETAANITQRLTKQDWQDRQRNYFAQADEQIRLIRNAFPDDAFPDVVSPTPTLNLFSVTNS